MPLVSEVLKDRPELLPAVVEMIDRLLTRSAGVSGRFYEAGSNYGREEFLDAAFWVEVGEMMLARGLAADLHELEAELCVISRRHQRRGPVDATVRALHGKIWGSNEFVDALMSDGVASTRLEAEVLLASLMLADADEARRLLRDFPLGRHLQWSTYCDPCDCDDPFKPRLPDAELVDDLGKEFLEGKRFLLFTYELPPNTERRKPTVADAYGGIFYFPFRVGGRTHPVRYLDRLAGRPEVVHEPIPGDCIRGKVGALTAVERR